MLVIGLFCFTGCGEPANRVDSAAERVVTVTCYAAEKEILLHNGATNLVNGSNGMSWLYQGKQYRVNIGTTCVASWTR